LIGPENSMSAWRDLADTLPGKALPDQRRSPQWRRVRDEFLRGKSCAVCGGRRNLVAHHRVPFHLAPHLELAEENLIAICEAKRYGINCHLLLGHLGNWQRTNVSVDADIAYWHNRIIESR